MPSERYAAVCLGCFAAMFLGVFDTVFCGLVCLPSLILALAECTKLCKSKPNVNCLIT